MTGPLAYFITWTTYGTWLHGDERGSVDDSSNLYGRPVLPPDRARHTAEARRAAHAPITLTDEMRLVVDRTIRAHCELREWPFVACNVRTNHVHLVVGARSEPPEIVMAQLKSWCTRRLREAGLVGRDVRAWTSHGSTRYPWDERSGGLAKDYVENRQ